MITVKDGTLYDDAFVAVSPPKETPQDECPDWLKPWQPNEFEVGWFKKFIEAMNHGAIWKTITTSAAYRIDKEKKEFVLIAGKVDEWYWKNVKTLAMLGYTVRKADDYGLGKTVLIPPT